MKVAYITAGAAGMYCGSCIRDNTLVAGLRSLGVESLLIPTYTPIRTDGEDISEKRVFFGGIHVYLAERFPFWRRAPRFITRVLEAPTLLRLASRLAVKNQPKELADLTLSILRGEEGHHTRELEDLCDWLETSVRPDLVHLTNSLLAGFAPTLKKRLSVPILCNFQGEDLFIGGLPEEYRGQILELIRRHSTHIDRFIATSKYYREFMSEYVGVPEERIDVVYPGVPAERYSTRSDRPRKSTEDSGNSVAIGYFARICPEKGLGLLVDAFERLKSLPGTENVRLRIAGYLGPGERGFLRSLCARLARKGYAGHLDVLGTLNFEEKVRFLSEADIFSVPAVYREPKGLYVLEALACGVPAVLPRHGAFPEILTETGGGLLVDPESPESLADGLYRLVRDPNLREELGQAGSRGVLEKFTDRHMAEATLSVYSNVTLQSTGRQS